MTFKLILLNAIYRGNNQGGSQCISAEHTFVSIWTERKTPLTSLHPAQTFLGLRRLGEELVTHPLSDVCAGS